MTEIEKFIEEWIDGQCRKFRAELDRPVSIASEVMAMCECENPECECCCEGVCECPQLTES